MMKTAVTAVLLSVAALTNAFTTGPPAVAVGKSVGVGRAMPRLVDAAPAFQSPATTESPREKDTALNNALREFANWNDVWDGDYGYGGYGMNRWGPYRSGYRRGGYGGYGAGLALRRDVWSRDASSTPVLSGSDVWRDDWTFPLTTFSRSRRGYGGYGGGYGGYGYGGYGGGYGGYGMGYGGGYGGYGMGYGGYGRGGYGGYGRGYGGYGGYGGGYGGYGGGYGLGYSNYSNFPETREFRARRRYSRDYYPNYGYGGYGYGGGYGRGYGGGYGGYGGYYGRGGYW